MHIFIYIYTEGSLYINMHMILRTDLADVPVTHTHTHHLYLGLQLFTIEISFFNCLSTTCVILHLSCTQLL